MKPIRDYTGNRVILTQMGNILEATFPCRFLQDIFRNEFFHIN